jgi:hypothetical protein
MNSRTALWTAAVAVVAAIASAGPAAADTITLSTEFSGATAASGAPKITFTQLDSDTVRITMDLANLSGTEKASKWFINTSFALSESNFAFVSGSSSTVDVDNTWNTNDNAFKADGDGYFDVRFDFPTSGDLFGDNETVVWDVTATGISVSTFLLGSAPGGGNGTWMSAAHIQGIGADGEDSGWMGGNLIPTPEPATVLLLGAGLAGFVARKRLRRTAA